MRKIIENISGNRLLLVICISVAICQLPTTYACAQKTKELHILHTNDTHSCIFPLNPNLQDTLVAGRGGYLRRIAMLKEERAKDPDLLYFDSGDFSQGSPYYTLYKGEVEAALMNEMHIDAATIGNHEFDFGMENMAHVFRQLNFPIVCANYDFTGTPVEGLVKPWVIIKRKGIKIGVFGLAPRMEGLVDMNKCVGVGYLDPAEMALKTATFLKKNKKCDLVICISHLGWDLGGEDDEYMIAKSRNIDLVLGGHSHSYLKNLEYVKNLDGIDIPVDQNGKHGIYIGNIKVTMKKK